MYWDLYGFVMWGMLTFVLLDFSLACCQAAPEWDQGWTWVSTWKSSRIRRHWSFKASWQIWLAEIKERFEIFDVSSLFFSGVSWYQGPQKHAQTPLVSSPKCSSLPAKKTLQNLLPHVPCCQKRTRLSKFCRKASKGLFWPRGGGVSPRQFLWGSRFDLSKVDHVSVSICSRRSFRSEWLGKCARPVALEHWFEVEEVRRPKLTMFVSFLWGLRGNTHWSCRIWLA